MNNPKILLIIPFFGKWPSYFNIYLKGCANNTWLDIIFFTDCEIPNQNLTNISFHKFSLKQFSELVTEKIGVEVNVLAPYKLCDFKPCYGLIFEDYLKNYDYWAYGDIDVIYGNLKPFLFDRIELGYDVLSNRAEILSGSLAIFKNTEYLKNLYSNSNQFIELLQSKKYEGLDETAFDHRTWNGGNKNYLPKHSFTFIINDESDKGAIKVSFETTCKEEVYKNEIINFKNGEVQFADKQLAYFHYVCNKNKEVFIFPNWKTVPDIFFISTTGFYKKNSLYQLTHNYRQIAGRIVNISTRIWKRLIKNQF